MHAVAAHNSSRLIDKAAAACSERPRVLFFLAAFAWCLCYRCYFNYTQAAYAGLVGFLLDVTVF